MFPQNSVVLIGFVKATVDGKAQILGYILLHKHHCNGKIAK